LFSGIKAVRRKKVRLVRLLERHDPPRQAHHRRSPEAAQFLKAQGLGASEIAKALKVGRASVYRVLEAG
jgi:DNA-binding transcriptional regulator LsrR (DeoR family)